MIECVSKILIIWNYWYILSTQFHYIFIKSKNIIHWSNTYFKFDQCLVHEFILIIYHPFWKKKNHNKLLLLFASVQFHVYFLSLFVWHMFEPISWSASKYFKELIQCEICSSIYRYINDDAFFVALSKNLCFFFFFRY